MRAQMAPPLTTLFGIVVLIVIGVVFLTSEELVTIPTDDGIIETQTDKIHFCDSVSECIEVHEQNGVTQSDLNAAGVSITCNAMGDCRYVEE